MLEVTLDKIIDADRVGYNETLRKSECIINNKTYHIYQIRKENILTYIGYLLLLILGLWEKSSFKGQEFLVRRQDVYSFNKESTASRRRNEKIIKVKFYENCKAYILNEGLEISDENAQRITKNIYKNLVKTTVTPIKQPKITKETGIDQVKLIVSFADKSIVFEMDQLLDSGSYKEVYQGYHFKLDTKTETSIKISTSQVAVLRVKENIEKAKKENKYSDNFDSSHVVKKSKYDFNDGSDWVMISEKLPFFFHKVFSYDSKTDAELIADLRLRYPFKKLIRGSKGVAKGLSEIHKKNGTHRDVKPANFAINKFGKGVVTDLGYFIQNGEFHSASLSPYYAPPELVTKSISGAYRWRRNAQNAKGDLWAFGMSLYKIYHPENLFAYPVETNSASGCRCALAKIKADPATFQTNLFKSWPAKNPAEVKLQALIAKLLSVQPEKRGTRREAYLDLKAIERLA